MTIPLTVTSYQASSKELYFTEHPTLGEYRKYDTSAIPKLSSLSDVVCMQNMLEKPFSQHFIQHFYFQKFNVVKLDTGSAIAFSGSRFVDVENHSVNELNLAIATATDILTGLRVCFVSGTITVSKDMMEAVNKIACPIKIVSLFATSQDERAELKKFSYAFNQGLPHITTNSSSLLASRGFVDEEPTWFSRLFFTQKSYSFQKSDQQVEAREVGTAFTPISFAFKTHIVSRPLFFRYFSSWF